MLRRHAFSDRYLAHSQKLVYNALTTPVELNRGQPVRFYQAARDLREVEFVYPYPESHHPKVGDLVEQPFKIERGYVNRSPAGSASTNPMLFTIAIGLILAWKVAGYIGVDYYLLPALGTPWRGKTATEEGKPALVAAD